MKNETIQCYKVDGGEMLINNLTKTQMKRGRYVESPLQALEDALDSHKYHLRNEEYHLKNRKEIVEKLQKLIDEYHNGDDSGIFGNEVNGVVDICKDAFKRL